MPVDSPMQEIGTISGVRYYFAEEGKFTKPGIKFWDGEKHVDVIQRIAELEAQLADAKAEIVRMQAGWRSAIQGYEYEGQGGSMSRTCRKSLGGCGKYADSHHATGCSTNDRTEKLNA